MLSAALLIGAVLTGESPTGAPDEGVGRQNEVVLDAPSPGTIRW
ncbi:hypothetical protein [Saccharothrix syringae]|nr:hypothetical protein [Saccharothrix syringae]